MNAGSVLIVGQGICGTVLSSLCFQNNIPFHVIDHPSNGSASIPAAGIINPVVFKRMLPGWMVESLLPKAFEYYSAMEKLLNDTFFHTSGILKIISNENENLLWAKGKSNDALYPFLSKTDLINPELSEVLATHHSLKLIKKAGWVDAPKFLSLWRIFLKEKKLLSESIFDYTQLTINHHQTITYKNITYHNIVFCEGNSVIKNPWFNHLPWVPTKGDLLLIKTEKKIPSNYVLNRNGFLLPMEAENLWLAGSTYHWDDQSPFPSSKGREEIINKIKKIIAVNFEIIDHWCGIRPGVTDRRPILGKHHLYPQINIFNGMGTKGFLLAPGLAEMLLSNTSLPLDCLPDRFVKSQRNN
jgi:glycine oxidase